MPTGKIASKLAKTITKKIRKGAAKELTDLGEPASTAATPRVRGQGTTGGIRESAQIAFTQTSKGKTLTKKIKELAKLQRRAASLSKEERKEFLSKNKDKMDALQESIKDMKRRGIEKKMGGGKVMNKKVTYRKEGKQIGSDPKTGATRGTGMEDFTSGKQPTRKQKPVENKNEPRKPSRKDAAKAKSLKDVPAKNQGLSKLPTKVRNKMGFKKGGGQAMKYRKGGMVYMKNGGVVKASNDGDKLVAACYDNGKKSKA
jgi:hypothetical protein